MKLHLDLEGINVILEIKKYHESTREKWDEEWCLVTFSLTSGSWLNYGKIDDPLLLCTEIEELRDNLEKLLSEKITKKIELEFLEPDFIFELIPQKTNGQAFLFDNQEYTESKIINWKIYFWYEGLSCNYLSVCLGKEEIEYLRNYLNLITGVIDRMNPLIEDMINKHILSE